jgi:hypothetical protein
MKSRSKFAVMFTIFLLGSLSCYAQDPVVGDWLGTIQAPGGIELRVLFKIKADDAGTYKATLDSLDQGMRDLPVSRVTVVNNQVKLAVNIAGGNFSGDLSADEQTLNGKWVQGGVSSPLILKRTSETQEIVRPQEPKPPFPYRREEVAYENPKADGVILAGTLSLPEGDGPWPVILFITGSGAQNRHEEILGHKPFLVISDYLVRRGFATLCVDDRGTAKSKGDFSKATTFDFADDVEAGIQFLQTRNEIDPNKIGLLGHSEGGLIAPIVAARNDSVAFIVLLAGPAVSGEEVILLQSELILETTGAPEATKVRAKELNKRIYTMLRETTDPILLKEKVQEILADLTLEERAGLDLDGQIKQLTTPWFKTFLSYDPGPTLEKVSCPVLAMYGEKDLQVPPSQSAEPMGEALAKSDSPNVSISIIPDHNHLFQRCETGAPLEYGKIEETISPLALLVISDWLEEIVQQ